MRNALQNRIVFFMVIDMVKGWIGIIIEQIYERFIILGNVSRKIFEEYNQTLYRTKMEWIREPKQSYEIRRKMVK
jgi:hypothetical protein